MSINSVSISGNLTRDAELKVTASGTPVLSGSVAVNERVKDASGNWTDKPNFIDWVLFGARAEKIAGFLTKGTKIALFGRLSYSAWTDKQGNKRSKLEVVVTELEFFRPSNTIMDAPTATAAAAQQQQQRMPGMGYQQQMDAYYQQ